MAAALQKAHTMKWQIEELLRQACAAKASDVHLAAGAPPMLRVQGLLQPLQLPQLTAQDTEDLLRQLVTAAEEDRFHATGELDRACVLAGIGRFRLHACRQCDRAALAIRIFAAQTPSLQALGLPGIVRQLAEKGQGLVLVTGPTGKEN